MENIESFICFKNSHYFFTQNILYCHIPANKYYIVIYNYYVLHSTVYYKKRVNKLNNITRGTLFWWPVCFEDHEVYSDRMYTFVSGARYAGVHAAGMNSIMIPVLEFHGW